MGTIDDKNKKQISIAHIRKILNGVLRFYMQHHYKFWELNNIVKFSLLHAAMTLIFGRGI